MYIPLRNTDPEKIDEDEDNIEDHDTEGQNSCQQRYSLLGHTRVVGWWKGSSCLTTSKLLGILGVVFFCIALINIRTIIAFFRITIFGINLHNVIVDNNSFMNSFTIINKDTQPATWLVKNEKYHAEVAQWSINATTWQFMFKAGPVRTKQCGYQYTARLLNQLGNTPYIWSYDSPNMSHLTYMEVRAARYLLDKHPEMEYLVIIDSDTVLDMVRFARAIASCGSPYLYGGVLLEARWPWKKRCDLNDTMCINNILQDDRMLLRPFGAYMDGPLMIFGRKLLEKFVYIMEQPTARPAMFEFEDAYIGYVVSNIPEVKACGFGYNHYQQLFSHPNKQTDPSKCFYNQSDPLPISYTIPEQYLS